MTDDPAEHDEQQRMPFGEALRRRRLAAGLSLADLAAAVHFSKSYLSRVENGHRASTPELARQCDAALQADGDLVRVAEFGARATARAHETGDSGEAWLVVLGPEGAGRLVPVSRRESLALGAVSLLQWNVGSSASCPGVQDTAVHRFRAMLAETRRLGRTTSPALVLPTLVTQIHAVRRLAGGASSRRCRDDLLLLAGRFAEFTGWMAQESGDDRASLWWAGEAARLAAMTGDSDLEAYALVRRAAVTMYADDPAGTVDLARAAQACRGLSPWARRSAVLREAQGHALAGDRRSCLRALDIAEAHDPAPAHGWQTLGSASVGNQPALVRGWCLYDLGSVRESAAALEDAVAAVPAGSHRARVRFAVRLAAAHAAAGEIHRACEVAVGVLPELADLDSATIRADLARLGRTLSRWQNDPLVQEMRPRLVAACRTGAHPDMNT